MCRSGIRAVVYREAMPARHHSDQPDGGRRTHLRTARADLSVIAARLHPRLLKVERLEGETVVMLFRPLMVDLLEATGIDSREARDILPPL